MKQEIKEFKKAFIYICLIGIFTHMYILTNKLLNFDEVLNLFSKGATLQLGRWGLELTKYIFPNYSMPVFNGMLSIFFISLSSCIICKILDIKNNVYRILLGAIMIVFPTFTCTLTFMYTAHSYCLAYLLAVLAVYFTLKDNKLFMLASIMLLTLSLGIYQAYISVFITLILIVSINQILKSQKIATILYTLVKSAIILIVSLLLYLLINNIVIEVFDITLLDYQGASKMGKITIKGSIFAIQEAYSIFLKPFFNNTKSSIGYISIAIYRLVICFNFIFLVINVIKNKKLKYHNLLLVLICIFLPIGMNSISILNQNGFNHDLINSANVFNYVLLIFLLESFIKKKYINRVCISFIIIQIYIYIIVANQSYLKMNIAYENAYSVYQDIVTRIKNMEEFDMDSKIVIVGEYDYKELCDFYNFNKIGYFAGVNSNFELVNVYSKYNFIEFYLGFNANFIEENQVKNTLENSEIYRNMPTYPYYGSIQKIDDLIVVKFSD